MAISNSNFLHSKFTIDIPVSNKYYNGYTKVVKAESLIINDDGVSSIHECKRLLWDWLSTEKGNWFLSNAVEPLTVHTEHNMENYSINAIVAARIPEMLESYVHLKWGII